MKILVTGQAGVGKTTILKTITDKKIFYADNYVKEDLYQKKGPVREYLLKTYPQIFDKNKIDYPKLGQILFSDEAKMEQINKLLVPYVRKWINDLPAWSIVEMAGYINNQKSYQNLFDKIILIKRKKYNLNDKFNYLKNKTQPIKKIKVEADYVIKNNGALSDAMWELKKVLQKIWKHKKIKP